MSRSERGFALLTVLVILAAVSLLAMAAMERASLTSTFGKAVEASHLRESHLRDAVVSKVQVGLSVGLTDACIEGVCGRTSNGVPRIWVGPSIASNGVMGDSNVGCAAVVVSEYLGSEGGAGFWRVAATCEDSLAMADVSVASNGLPSLEWSGP